MAVTRAARGSSFGGWGGQRGAAFGNLTGCKDCRMLASVLLPVHSSEEVKEQGWTAIRWKRDWKRVFAFKAVYAVAAEYERIL
jgi:hypothetical protein